MVTSVAVWMKEVGCESLCDLLSIISSGRLSLPDISSFIETFVYTFTINHNQVGGGQMAHWFLKIKSQIDLKPGCKFKFVHCLETYVKKLVSLDHEGTLEGPFLSRVPWFCFLNISDPRHRSKMFEYSTRAYGS